jgi:hypothetical protein
MFLHRRWLQKLSIKVQVLIANLVAMCVCRMVTRTTRGQPRGMQALRFSALSWCGRCGWESTHDQ